ncbi:Phenazine biosynthesis protein PhzA, partial [Pseudomonas sp. FEN]
ANYRDPDRLCRRPGTAAQEPRHRRAVHAQPRRRPPAPSRAVYRGRLRRFLEHRQRHPAGLPRPRQAGGPGCLAGPVLPGLAVAQRADLRNRRPESLLGRKRRARQREYARLPEGLLREPLHPFLRTRGWPDQAQPRVHEPLPATARPRHSRADHSPRRPTRL